jgi:hypothetical protein
MIDRLLSPGTVAPPLAGLWDAIERLLADAQDSPAAVVVILVGLALGFVLAWWWANRDGSAKPTKPNPALVFEEVVQAHQLPSRDRRLVRAVAQAVGMERPADAFVRPDAWDRFAPDDESVAAAARDLRRRLFDSGD